MFTSKDSRNCQQFSAKIPPYHLGRMALQLDQNYSLPCFPPSTLTANVSIHESPELRGVATCQQNAFGGSSKLLPSYLGNANPNRILHPKDSFRSVGLGVADSTKPIDSSQRRFLIFDQSGNHTRLYVSPSFPRPNQIIAPKSNTAFANGSDGKLAPLVDHELLCEPTVEEKWDENHLSDEVPEDSEEINALLYSDSDDEYDEDDGENDEVTSMRRPPLAIEEVCDKEKFLEEFTEEEVASCGGSHKRQRLLDGGYKKPSLVSPLEKRASTFSYEDGVGSSCGGIDWNKREKMVKVRDALKILASIIPGLKTNDPLTVIDHAIGYLKSMKTEAETLGLGCLEQEPASFS